MRGFYRQKLLLIGTAAVCAMGILYGRSRAQSAEDHSRALLLISIDGMRPDYVTAAQEHGVHIPTLRAFMKNGAYATGVHGVLPTVTYPSHTTLLTGVSPSKHGIYSNTPFDPLRKNMAGWYWYSEDIRVKTLWQAASEAGLKVGSVSWPVSVMARGVDYLIPEYWRAATPDDLKLVAALSTPGLLAHLQNELGPYTTDLNQAIHGDVQRTRYAAAILKENKPEFMTVHLGALDHVEHGTGPFSKESDGTLEQLDGMVKTMADAMRASHPGAAVAVVSDHGFTRVDHHLHLMKAFVDAGLVEIDPETEAWPEPKVLNWKAEPWIDGGSAAVVLRNANDEPTRGIVKQLLDHLAADLTNGIAHVFEPTDIQRLGGDPQAAFWVDMKSNFALDAALREPIVAEAKVGGTHGYSPDNPDLLASFFMTGPGIKPGLNLGQIDMRSIAPTLAQYLGARLDGAEGKVLALGASE
ncbi:MAG TPA: ectonucleotide pyrophosphatase/phosphodiesterase [Bryobacteraceae bacterium]|nr:ectonucleotide pyrophosphatase/phosphodiesterase [Bryobacteraceae bacterium]